MQALLVVGPLFCDGQATLQNQFRMPHPAQRAGIESRQLPIVPLVTVRQRVDRVRDRPKDGLLRLAVGAIFLLLLTPLTMLSRRLERREDRQS